MKQFNVLPTEERFKNLTEHQLSFILENMIRDSWEQEQVAKGRTGNIMEDDDTSWYDTPTEEFEPVPDFLDADDLAKQAYDRLSESEKAKMNERAETELDEDNEEELIHENKMEMIQENIRKLDESLNIDDNQEYTQENISQALDEFDDDDLYI